MFCWSRADRNGYLIEEDIPYVFHIRRKLLLNPARRHRLEKYLSQNLVLWSCFGRKTLGQSRNEMIAREAIDIFAANKRRYIQLGGVDGWMDGWRGGEETMKSALGMQPPPPFYTALT